MKKIEKRHLILGTLLVALGAAVYLNWQFGVSQNVDTTSKELGTAKYVNATVYTEPESTQDQVSQTSNMTSQQQAYFSDAKNQRSQTQDKILETANAVLQNEKATDEEIKEAVESINELLKTFTYQDSIESVLKAKGFSQCLCYITEDSCNVIVLQEEMNETSAIMIKDAVNSQIEIPFDNISIVEV